MLNLYNIAWDDAMEAASDKALQSVTDDAMQRAEQPDIIPLRMQFATLTRVASHCYHGYFCAGPGGMSKSGTQHIHEIGGMKHEVDLQRHTTSKAAYVDKHGAQAYQQRAGRLRAAANQGAKTLSTADVQHLGAERDHLITLLAGKSGNATERAQWKSEATMIQRQLQRSLKAQQQAAKTGTAKTAHAGGGRKGGAHGKAGHGTSSAHAAHTLLETLMHLVHTVSSHRATTPAITHIRARLADLRRASGVLAPNVTAPRLPGGKFSATGRKPRMTKPRTGSTGIIAGARQRTKYGPLSPQQRQQLQRQLDSMIHRLASWPATDPTGYKAAKKIAVQIYRRLTYAKMHSLHAKTRKPRKGRSGTRRPRSHRTTTHHPGTRHSTGRHRTRRAQEADLAALRDHLAALQRMAHRA